MVEHAVGYVAFESVELAAVEFVVELDELVVVFVALVAEQLTAAVGSVVETTAVVAGVVVDVVADDAAVGVALGMWVRRVEIWFAWGWSRSWRRPRARRT